MVTSAANRDDYEGLKFDEVDGEIVVKTKVNQLNIDGSEISVQNPLPADGDAVYAKDLLIDTSDPGDFVIPTEPTADKERILSSMVSNVEIEKKNDTLDNPKSVTLKFKRPVVTSSFGIDSGPNGTFSNVKLTVYQGQNSQVIVDESADNTKRTINLFSTGPTKFDKILIEFHTTDTITTGLFGIFKSIETESTLRALNPSGEVVNIDATAGGNLKVAVEETLGLENPVSTELTLTTANTAYLMPAAELSDRSLLIIYNKSDTSIYIGSSSVTTSNGILLATGKILEIKSKNNLYVVCGVSGKIINLLELK